MYTIELILKSNGTILNFLSTIQPFNIKNFQSLLSFEITYTTYIINCFSQPIEDRYRAKSSDHMLQRER